MWLRKLQLICSFTCTISSHLVQSILLESIDNSLKLVPVRDESTRLLFVWYMDWVVCQTLAGPSVSLSVHDVRASPGSGGEIWWPGCWCDLVWWVRSQREAKAERWSSSVSLAHSKVAISQDWLATSPLARWLFPLVLLFSFYSGSPFLPLILLFSVSLKFIFLFYDSSFCKLLHKLLRFCVLLFYLTLRV